MKKLNKALVVSLFLLWGVPAAGAPSWLEEGMREIEELRMRQLQTVQDSGKLAPFTTDGCSGGQTKNWELLAETFPGFEEQFGDRPPWESCCFSHDEHYWQGGALNGYARRKAADAELKQCVIDTGNQLIPELSNQHNIPEEKIKKAFEVTAELMYQAVRIGGQPCSLLPWRWGYGWDNCAFVGISDMEQNYSNLKQDEHITLFDTAGWLDEDGKHWHIPVHAWVYEPQNSKIRRGLTAQALKAKYDLVPTSETEANFRRRVNLLIADNERGKRIIIRIAGRDFSLPESKPNGHVSTILKLPAEVVSALSEQGWLRYFAVMRPGDERRFEGEVRLLSKSGLSVISDIDDTIKISHVMDRKQLLDNTFFKDFVEVPGMPGLYSQLAEQGVAIHFVSSSPWHLYDPLEEFIHQAGFPKTTMNLKSIRFRDKTLLNLFKKGTETKPRQIEPLLQRYPKRKFILFGDSGEQDPEVYGGIARRFADQIQAVFIRNVDGSNAEDERYRLAFEGIARGKWQLFDRPEQIPIDRLLQLNSM